MTAADRLRNMADNATPGPWGVRINEAKPRLRNVLAPNKAYGASGLLAPVITPDDARLIALAPDLAKWAADAADALNEAWQTGADGALPGHGMLVAWEELLARLGTITGNDQ